MTLFKRSSTSQSSLECRLEHIPFYSWIELNLTKLHTDLARRGLNEQEINDKEQIIINNLKVNFYQFLI